MSSMFNKATLYGPQPQCHPSTLQPQKTLLSSNSMFQLLLPFNKLSPKLSNLKYHFMLSDSVGWEFMQDSIILICLCFTMSQALAGKIQVMSLP